MDDEDLFAWCGRHLGARPAAVLFRDGHLSQVVGVELADGRGAVVKVRPFEPRLAGCVAVQEHLARAGFPCPMPLTGAVRAGELAVTAETLVSGGTQLPAAGGAAPFAALLARLISAAPDPAAVSPLTPGPPWTAWDHPGTRLWPGRDDRGRDLNDIPGPAWLDDAARRVRARLGASAAPACVGHGDWMSQNIRWRGAEPLAVHDWDSVIAQPETAVVGMAAAIWTGDGGPGPGTTVAQSAEFIAAYQQAAGRAWTVPEVRNAWAAGLWTRLFDARQEAADGGGPLLDRLGDELGDRLALSALDHA